MATLIHITHEACEKMGGIGAVLEGLLTSRAYQEAVDRTLLVGTAHLPLERPHPDIAPLYPPSARPDEAAPAALEADLAKTLAAIEAAYGVRLLYGRRTISCPLGTRRARVELVLFDVRDARPEPINLLKGLLWETYGLESNRFEADWGYEEWVRVAGPVLDAVAALLGGRVDEAVLVSHEFMGLPTLLAGRVREPTLRTVYWAHEVPAVRDLVERHARRDNATDTSLETLEGLRSYASTLREWGGYKHALVSQACRTHRIFAVSDRIAEELRLLSEEFHQVAVDVVYNGLPVRPIDLEARLRSRGLLREFAQRLVGFAPDYVFTHVARPVASKAIERDLTVLDHLDDLLAERGQTAVLLVLATDAGRRDPDLVRRMEAEYGWPVHHRAGWPDLVKGEVPIGRAAEEYNACARVTRAVLINQFGFSRETCGERVPEGVTLQDLRQGSDVEFGQSAYEPFGIAQLETLAFGGISVLSRACGSAHLLRRVAGERLPPNVLMPDYGTPPVNGSGRIQPTETRRMEHEIAARLAKELADRLPVTPAQFADLLRSGWALARRLSWQAVCETYFVPALEQCLGRKRRRPRRRHRRSERPSEGP